MTIKRGLLIYLVVGLIWGSVIVYKNPECNPDVGYDFHIVSGVVNGFLWPVTIPITVITWGVCK